MIKRRTIVAVMLASVMVRGRPVGAAVQEIRVVSSGGFAAAYKALAPGFEQASGDRLITGWGPSMGTTKDAVPVRLARGEPIDVVIMVGYALSELIQQGKVLADSRVDLARSGIGVVVKAGAPHPDISTVAGLKGALLAAKSVAYSDSASGVYIQNTLFPRLDLTAAMQGKARMIPAEPVGAVVARGEAELGFQQISELKPIHGIDLVGPLPAEVQQITVFSAGIVTGSAAAQAARALLAYLSSPEAAPIITETGLDPIVDSR
jgi:molybdate transport system substrate-binding protein